MSDHITMWRLDSAGKIEKVLCSQVTEKSVFIAGEPNWKGEMRFLPKPQREAVSSGYRSYHKTWADAHAALLAKAERELDAARLRLQRAQGDHGRIKGMKPPVEEPAP